MTILIRNFLDSKDFIEVETPILIGSTPEGARDFVVPSRMNPGQFYALPQSPQTLKQLLMVSGFDRYFQIAKCFRDEDLRADRQPEFTQIDCEMSFVDQDDVINLFEDMARHLFKEIRGVELPAKLQQMTWHEAMRRFGSDKPDLRFGMEFVELMDTLKGTGSFEVFNSAEYIGGICVPGCASYTRKQIDQLTDFVKKPQVGAKGLVWVKFNEDGSVKSQKQCMPISKFEDPTRATVNEDRGTRDAFIIRVAEMYLIVAEAGAKAGKADALAYMNILRSQRAKAGKEEAMKVAQSDIEDIDFILDERARELVGEQLRWFDLKRMGSEIFIRRIKAGNPDAGKNVKAYHMLRPFPQTLLDAITNKDEFLQNEGYK